MLAILQEEERDCVPKNLCNVILSGEKVAYFENIDQFLRRFHCVEILVTSHLALSSFDSSRK